jgi:septal ring factor EnvC (AmiA/AmiB activator)
VFALIDQGDATVIAAGFSFILGLITLHASRAKKRHDDLMTEQKRVHDDNRNDHLSTTKKVESLIETINDMRERQIDIRTNVVEIKEDVVEIKQTLAEHDVRLEDLEDTQSENELEDEIPTPTNQDGEAA